MSVRSFTLALFALCVPMVAQAQAKDDSTINTVRYSYEKWSRTGQARFLLVPKPTTVPAGTLQDRTRALFKKLLGDKRNTYGDARLAFQPDAITTGIVYVYLDAKKAQYNPITMAETTYTFTENGATRVVFPKVQAQGWTRENVPFPAYVLSLPLWQALPPVELTGALVSLPDGSLQGVENALTALGKGDKALAEAVWSYVKSGPDAAALAAVTGAALLKLEGVDARLIALLGDGREAIRRAALTGLAGNDTAAINLAVRKVMDADTSDALRDQAALQLGQSKDVKFSVAAQYHALNSKDPKVVAKAAQQLGESKEAEAGEKLLGIVGHADGGVRRSAVESLLARGDRKPLVALLGGELSAEIQLEIARALAGTADKAAIHPALIHLATLGKGDDAAKATERLAGFDKKATYAALGTAAKHPEAATRRAAAKALRSLNKPEALAHLAGADVTDKDTGEEMLAAIRAIYAGQSLDFVLKGTKSKTAVLQRSAVATLGDMVAKKSSKRDRKTIVGALDSLSKDSDPLIRAAAARSYGTMPGADVAGNVKTLTKDDAVEVKRAIAKSLSAYPGKETNVVLLGFAAQADIVLKANALGSLGFLEVPSALDAVVTHLNHEDARVRRAATGALVAIGAKLEAAKRKPMLSFFSERVFDKDAEVRLKAVKGLELVNDPRTVTALAALLQDPVLEVRQATLMAMASTGDGGAAEPISTGFEDDELAVRRTAIEALGVLNRKEGKALLKAYAEKEQDKALADLARATLAKIK